MTDKQLQEGINLQKRILFLSRQVKALQDAYDHDEWVSILVHNPLMSTGPIEIEEVTDPKQNPMFIAALNRKKEQLTDLEQRFALLGREVEA